MTTPGSGDGHGGATPEAAPHDAGAENDNDTQRVEELTAELAELNAQYARAVADYQNLRRRSEESRHEQARHTLAAVIINYLPILDDLERALESVHEHEELADHQWVEGVRMVERKFRSVLEAGGVREIEAEGLPFDPQVHAAISYAPGPKDQVVALAQRGYVVGDFVIRAASVVVGDGEVPPGSTEAEDAAPE